MGDEKISAAVTDAGPLIHLAEIGELALLRIFAKLLVPDGVWAETIGAQRLTETDLSVLENIERVTLTRAEVEHFVQTNALDDLHAGEQESLCLCHRAHVTILLTDDLSVRDTAKRLNLTPVGSLGVVVKACQLGIISPSQAKKSIFDLYDVSSLFVTRAIVEIAVEQLRRQG